jgi:outer membrane protein
LNKYILSRFGLALLGAFLWIQGAAAQENLRIGFVNAVKVLEAAPQAESARSALEKEFSARDRELVATQKSIKAMEDKLDKDGAIMSEAERSKLEREIVAKRRDLKRDQDEFREDVNFRRNEEFGKIQREIVEAIHQVAKDKQFDLVVGEGVIFASKKVDITDSVIEKLKAGYKGGSAKKD